MGHHIHLLRADRSFGARWHHRGYLFACLLVIIIHIPNRFAVCIGRRLPLTRPSPRVSACKKKTRKERPATASCGSAGDCHGPRQNKKHTKKRIRRSTSDIRGGLV